MRRLARITAPPALPPGLPLPALAFCVLSSADARIATPHSPETAPASLGLIDGPRGAAASAALGRGPGARDQS